MSAGLVGGCNRDDRAAGVKVHRTIAGNPATAPSITESEKGQVVGQSFDVTELDEG